MLTRNFSPAESARWRGRIFEIYARMRSASQSRYSIESDAIKLTVFPGVYAPQFFTDSEWFAREVAQIVRNKTLLEIGTGTGIIGLYCARNSARVVATDISPVAVENAKLNATDLGLNIDVREGDVYAAAHSDEQFDFIFWAHPFNNWPEPVTDMLFRSGMDYRYQGVTKFIAGAADHLAEDGRLLLGTGDTADLQTVYDIAETHGYEPKLLKEADMPLAEWGDERIRYMIVEFCRKQPRLK